MVVLRTISKINFICRKKKIFNENLYIIDWKNYKDSSMIRSHN